MWQGSAVQSRFRGRLVWSLVTGLVRRHINTELINSGSSIVSVTGCLGGSIMPATGLYSIGKSAQNLVSRSQAYRHNQLSDSDSSTVQASGSNNG